MRFLIIDVDHLGAYFAAFDVSSAVGFVKVDFEAGKFLLAVFAYLEILLFHNTQIILNLNQVAQIFRDK